MPSRIKYSIVRVIRKPGKDPVRFYVRGPQGTKVFGFKTFQSLTRRYRKAGLEYEVKYHLPPKSRPVPQPKLAADESELAVVNGVNAKNGVVLHSTESHDRPGLSDVKGVNSYLRGKGYGVHYIVDGDGNILKGADHGDRVSHCKGANSTHIGIEMIGRAAWKTRRWLWDPTPTGRKRRKQLRAVIELVAFICDSEEIGIRLDKDHGVSRHSDHPEGGHWDPGKSFPIGYVLKQARRHRAKYRRPQW